MKKKYKTAYLVMYGYYDDWGIDNVYFSKEEARERVIYLNHKDKKSGGYAIWEETKIKVFM